MGRFFYDAFHHVWSIVILLVCVLVYLWAVGLPDPATRALLRRIGTGPFRLEVERIRIDFTEGLVGEGIRFFEPDAPTNRPLFRADAVGIHLHWLALPRSGPVLREVRVRRGELAWPEAGLREPVELTNMTARIRFETNAVRFSEMTVALFGVLLEGQGVVKFGERAGPPADPWAELTRVIAAARKTPPWLQDLGHELDGARHDGTPRGRVDFKLFAGAPQSNEVAVVGEGGGTRIRGAKLDGWNMEVRLRERILAVSNLALRVGANTLHVTARCDLSADRLEEGRLYSDIPPRLVLKLFPEPIQRRFAKLGAALRGGMKAELWAGPVAMGEVAENYAGWMSLQEADLRGVPFEKLFASFRREGPVMQVTSLKGVVGRAGRTGPIEASFNVDHATGDVDGTLNLHCFLDDFSTVLKPAQVRIVERFAFGEQPPRFEGGFHSNVGRGEDFRLQGTLRGTNLHYHGQFVAGMEVGIAYSNAVLDLAPFRLAREDGEVDGGLRLDFSNDWYDVDLRSTIDPNAVVRIVGPGLTRGLSFLTFEGPARVHAFGRIDGDDESETDLRVDVEGERVALEWFRAERCSVGVDVRGKTYTITNLAGQAAGGALTGTIEAYPDADTDHMRYRLDLTLEGADFARLASAFRPGTNETSQGLITCTFKGEGLADTNALASLRGGGRVEIRGGRLLTMPLFGGLSRLLSAIYPGLGFAAQTDFQSDYTIAGQKIHMRDAMLGGAVVSIRANGYYSFDGKLRFTVEVKPLRSGPVAAVLRLLTLPVTKLLKFDLGGTFDQPKWRPTNLPKEMFFIFD